MKKLVSTLFAALVVASCNSDGQPLTSSEAQQKRELEQRAISNAGCKFQDQSACAHLVEHRSLFASFFLPVGFGNKTDLEREKGIRITTKFVVNAASSINQCMRVTDESLPLIKNMKIAGKPFTVMATKPVNETAACFITPEAS